MVLGSHKGKEPTKKEMAERAQEMDLRRQAQIQTQVAIINRLASELLLLEAVVTIVAEGVEGEAKDVAADALVQLESLREEARKAQQEQEKQGGENAV